MLIWVVATTKRIVFVGLASIACAVAMTLLTPVTKAALSWPLWLSIPVVVLVTILQFGCWAAAVTIPIVGFGLIVYGRPWRETTPSARQMTAPPRRAVPSVVSEDTVTNTLIRPRRSTVPRTASDGFPPEDTITKSHPSTQRSPAKA